jgi:hypothetical protein
LMRLLSQWSAHGLARRLVRAEGHGGPPAHPRLTEETSLCESAPGCHRA